MRYPAHLKKLVEIFKQLPGVGTKSAERFAFHLLASTPQHLELMGNAIKEIPRNLRTCPECGCLCEQHCTFCVPPRIQTQSLCVIATLRDVFAVEFTSEYKGLYHVLGGLLSPLGGFDADHLSIAKLKERIQRLHIKEIILAMDSTLEGDATALYLKRELEPICPRITRLAFGLPMGSSLDYIDGGTLARALAGRAQF